MSKFNIIHFSRQLKTHEQSYLDIYTKRIKHYQSIDIQRFSESSTLSKVFKQTKPASSFIFTLDEKGKHESSEHFAKTLQNKMQSHKHIHFILGASHGLPSDHKQYSDTYISLSKMTLPHRLCLILLCEQIYRALSIQQGHPYHH